MAKELTFLKANVILTGTQLMTGNEQYPLSDISYAEVVTRRYPVDWWSFIQVNTVVFLGFAALWAILTAFGWGNIPGPFLAIWWLFIFIRSARMHAKSSYRHTLTLHTRSGTVETATLEDDDPLLQACEAINSRIKRNAATPRPPQSGEPTRWMQAN